MSDPTKLNNVVSCLREYVSLNATSLNADTHLLNDIEQVLDELTTLSTALREAEERLRFCNNVPIADGNGLGGDDAIQPGDPKHCVHCSRDSVQYDLIQSEARERQARGVVEAYVELIEMGMDEIACWVKSVGALPTDNAVYLRLKEVYDKHNPDNQPPDQGRG